MRYPADSLIGSLHSQWPKHSKVTDLEKTPQNRTPTPKQQQEKPQTTNNNNQKTPKTKQKNQAKQRPPQKKNQNKTLNCVGF